MNGLGFARVGFNVSGSFDSTWSLNISFNATTFQFHTSQGQKANNRDRHHFSMIIRFPHTFLPLAFIPTIFAAQPSASPPVSAPLRELPWAQLNFLHTTDTHGWHAGHLQEYAQNQAVPKKLADSRPDLPSAPTGVTIFHLRSVCMKKPTMKEWICS